MVGEGGMELGMGMGMGMREDGAGDLLGLWWGVWSSKYFLFLPQYLYVPLPTNDLPLSISIPSPAFMKNMLMPRLSRRHMAKKEQKQRELSGVNVDFDGVGMGRTQEVGVVEDEGLDEKYLGREGGEVKDGFEKDVKVLERSVRSLEL